MPKFSASAQSNELTDVAANLQRALRPIAPPPAFRKHLRDGLRMAAEHQLTQRAVNDTRQPRNGTGWGWVIGAAVIGALLSFIVTQLRARQMR